MMITKRIFNEAKDLDLTSEKYEDLYFTIKEKLNVYDILGIFRVDKEGLLYEALQIWYEHKKIDPVDYEDNDYIYFTHGYGYALYDDIVGGNGSSEKQKEFLDYINSID